MEGAVEANSVLVNTSTQNIISSGQFWRSYAEMLEIRV
jgi:hypothetical protein